MPPCPKDVSDAPEMRRCPDCRAPNPPIRAVCYACGQRLNKPAAPLTTEPTYECLNCESPLPYSAQSCPACGRVARPTAGAQTALETAALVPMPLGWEIEPLPDGTIRLRRSGAAKLFDANPFAVFMGASLFVIWGSAHLFERFLVTLLSLLAWGTLLTPIVLLGVAAFIRREELRVGKDFLEWRWNVLGIRQKKRLRDGLFRIEQWMDYEQRGGRVIYTELIVIGTGGRIRLLRQARREQTPFGHVTGSRDLSLFPDDLQILGNYLAAQTGWLFVPPSL